MEFPIHGMITSHASYSDLCPRDIFRVRLLFCRWRQLNYYVPRFWLAAPSVAMSRLMLSMRSLAPSISSDPDLLLSMSELSRVRWKPGSSNREIHVEIDTVEPGVYELHDVEENSTSGHISQPRIPAIHMTRVGVYDP